MSSYQMHSLLQQSQGGGWVHSQVLGGGLAVVGQVPVDSVACGEDEKPTCGSDEMKDLRDGLRLRFNCPGSEPPTATGCLRKRSWKMQSWRKTRALQKPP
ncbi:hypothetical protein EYF80_026966 [Liparis tanakae]|uniref:Uncharacterized protein n=1 Tax=Liparis tanakae TaxID=230148 RepID=A0A4Z2HB87_9TELE|nr:hypothetical protein EYF80_026966 [Liparis tanakae]